MWASGTPGGGIAIKTRDIFFVINEISYALSLSSEPQQLADLLLDKLVQVLNVDSCWVQLLDPGIRELRLVAARGFTPAMEHAPGLSDPDQGLSSRVMMGHRALIPDLARNGAYGLSDFAADGFRSLIAVPIRTYRTHGVIGIAGRARKQFPGDAGELLVAVAGILAATLNTQELARLALDDPGSQTGAGAASGEVDRAEAGVTETVAADASTREEQPAAKEPVLLASGSSEVPAADEAFLVHGRSMDSFRSRHRQSPGPSGLGRLRAIGDGRRHGHRFRQLGVT